MLKYLVAFLLFMHGLAHVTGLVGFWTSGPQAFGEKAWLFSKGIRANSGVGRAFGLLWLVALIGFVGTALGLLFGQAWWPVLAVAAAAVSLVAIVPWIRAVPPGAWGGALLDVVVLVMLLSPWAERIVEAVS
jgi:hypothetical protein